MRLVPPVRLSTGDRFHLDYHGDVEVIAIEPRRLPASRPGQQGHLLYDVRVKRVSDQRRLTVCNVRPTERFRVR